jgi:hypothetical protein
MRKFSATMRGSLRNDPRTVKRGSAIKQLSRFVDNDDLLITLLIGNIEILHTNLPQCVRYKGT